MQISPYQNNQIKIKIPPVTLIYPEQLQGQAHQVRHYDALPALICTTGVDTRHEYPCIQLTGTKPSPGVMSSLQVIPGVTQLSSRCPVTALSKTDLVGSGE